MQDRNNILHDSYNYEAWSGFQSALKPSENGSNKNINREVIK